MNECRPARCGARRFRTDQGFERARRPHRTAGAARGINTGARKLERVPVSAPEQSRPLQGEVVRASA